MKKEQVMKTLRAYSMVIVLVVIAVLFHLLTNGLIFTAMNLTNIILQNSYVVLLILGMLPVILTGNVDLSVGSVLAFVGAIAAILQVNYHCGVLVTLLVSLLVGILIGCWQGMWIAYFDIPAFLVTLSGELVFRGLTQVVLDGASIGPFSDTFRAIASSFMISADDAHAWHPNYDGKYDPTNHAVMGGGPVIKINANCKYMTDAHSAAIFRALCEEVGVPFQYFVNHSDVAGGSTLGNILTSQIDIEGVDVGNPLLAMHSVRELGSVFDHNAMTTVFVHFFS